MTDIDSYVETLEHRLVAAEYEQVDLPPEARLDTVYAREEANLSEGRVHKYVAVVPAPDLDGRELRETCTHLHEVMTNESFTVFGVGEKTLGYVVFVTEDIDEGIRNYVTDLHSPLEGSSMTFPVVVDLDAEQVVHTPSSQSFFRTVFEVKETDVSDLFAIPGAD